MSVVSEVKLTVTKTINLGNYESVKIEGGVVVGRDSDDDTPQGMRDRCLEEIAALLEEAKKDHVPARRRRED
jgi:hypothetical protein